MKNTILIALALGANFGLTSCVAPLEPTVTTTTTTRAYQPGYSVETLPGGYRSEVISGTNYYYYNGAYYKRRSNGYVVVDAPRRSRYYNEYTRYGNTTVHNHADGSSHVISDLPRGYSTEYYHGKPYYRHQGRYYSRQGSGYVTVAKPY